MQYIEVQLSNAYERQSTVIIRKAIISEGQSGIIIPQEIALQLCLEKIGQRALNTVFDTPLNVPQVGPLTITAGKHSITCSALVWEK